MILSDGTLERRLDPQREFGEHYPPLLSPPPAGRNAIQPASVDVHLGDEILVATRDGHRQVKLSEDPSKTFVLRQWMLPEDWWGLGWQDRPVFQLVANPLPSMFVLGSTKEEMDIPANLVGFLDGKSTWARKGLEIHRTAGLLDPGFQGGHVTLEMSIVGPGSIPLTAGMIIGQVRFHQMDRPAVRPYGHVDRDSHYQGQRGPTPAAY